MNHSNKINADGKTSSSLQELHEAINRLLEKFHVESHLLKASQSPQYGLERILLEKQQDAELERQLNKLHVADLAALLEALASDNRNRAWHNIPASRQGEVFLELSDAVLKSLIQSMSRDEIIAALIQLDADDLACLSDEIPAEALHDALARLSSEERSWVRTTITYAENSIGHLMNSDIIILQPQQSLASVQEVLRNKKQLPGHSDKLFVSDKRGHFIGAVFLQDILLNDSNTTVDNIMREHIVTFHPHDNMDEAAHAFERYDLVSAPVINDRGKLLGRLTIDTVLDYVRTASHVKALNVVGVVDSEDLFSRVWASARNRWLWLGINLITAFIISRVIGVFELTIARMVALASLMPIIASVAGNTGNQTAALVIRSIALNQLHGSNFWHLLRKELAISLLNGAVWGILVGVFAYVFYQQAGLSVVITVAMMLSFLLAASLGVGAPVLLARYGRDPVMGSSVILTGMIDALGFFVFLMLATVFLV